jgi:hypothetical protein
MLNKRTKAQTARTCSLVWFMVFNATFNNISGISWRPVLLFEETKVALNTKNQSINHYCKN